jgi:uncharacterized protein
MIKLPTADCRPPTGIKILIAGISVRAMVESAVRGNYPVIALDAFGDQDLRAQAETHPVRLNMLAPYSPKALYETGRHLGCGAMAYTSNLENHPEILELFALNHRIIGNSPRTVRSVRNWPFLFSCLSNAGFPVPETSCPCEVRSFDPDRRWIIKPVLSGGGHGISFLNEEQFVDNCSIVQEYLPGKSCSAAFIADGRESVVLGISEQLVGMPDFGGRGFRYCGSILPLPEILDPDRGAKILEQARRTASFLTAEFGLTGVNGFDFILDADQVRLIEVNPRYTASMELIERAYGLSVFQLHVEAVLHGTLPQFRLESLLNVGGFFGKSILFSEKDAVVPENLNWRAWDTKDIPAPGEQLRKGSPICTIFAGQPSYDETFAELVRQTEMIKDRIYG